MVNFVGRLETVSEDVDHLLSELGLPLARLPHFNRGAQRDYRSLYNAHTKAIIGTVFAEDIERFGYDFDGVTDPGMPIAYTLPRATA
jgi:hypothetical protein